MLETFMGNDDIKSILKSAVKSGRFPHAIIIEGESGSGRHTLARIIAAAALCDDTTAPCGVCRVCNLISSDTHCDVLTYSPDGATFKVDTIRKLRQNTFVYPIEAKRKVNILLDCDKMNDSAQNALLKVLEEPPSFMVFILICENASSLLSTVRSRCVTLTVKNPDLSVSAEYVLAHSKCSYDEVTEALSQTHGNVGQALNILEGNEHSSAKNAALYFSSLEQKDRLGCLKALFPFEKDRALTLRFLVELKRLVSEKLRLTAVCAEASSLSAKQLLSVLKKVGFYEQAVRRHVGKPLQISLIGTALTAEIFALF